MPFTEMTAYKYRQLYLNRKLFKSKPDLLLPLSEAHKLVEKDRLLNKAVKDYEIPEFAQKIIAKRIEEEDIAKDDIIDLVEEYSAQSVTVDANKNESEPVDVYVTVEKVEPEPTVETIEAANWPAIFCISSGFGLFDISNMRPSAASTNS